MSVNRVTKGLRVVGGHIEEHNSEYSHKCEKGGGACGDERELVVGLEAPWSNGDNT